MLGHNSYGKSGVRLLKVERAHSHHTIRDLTVDLALEGDFVATHVKGDNTAVLPTDTMKNVVYAKARELTIGEPEDFAAALATHLLGSNTTATVARVTVAEHTWRRLDLAGTSHDHAFEGGSTELRIARARAAKGEELALSGGIDRLRVLKSAQSAFSGFPRDRYTTLRETEDRILATSVTAEWTYATNTTDFGGHFRDVRGALLETFAQHDSRSVQHTLYAMGEAALARCGAISEIHITMPNAHHLLVDLSPFALENPNEIFVPTSEPYGLISATIRRG